MTPQKIRNKIVSFRDDLARAEGQVETLSEQADATMTKLRKLLKCKKGKEKEALRALREQVTEDEEALTELLDTVHALKDGAEDDE